MATAKRGRRRTVELANLPDVPETPDDGQGIPYMPVQTVTEERRERELEDILEDLGTDSRIRVWQIQDGKSSYAGEISAEGFTLDSLLETFGGGEKSLAIVQGKRVVEKTKVFLDPSVPAKNPRSPKGAAQPAGGLGDVSSLIAAQAAQSMSMMQMVQGMMSMSQQSTAALVTAMTGMMAANNGNRKDPTEIALQIAQVLKGDNKGAGTAEMFAMLKEGITLGERLGGGGDDDDGVMGVVKEGVSILGNLVTGIVEERKAKNVQARLQAGLPVVSHPTDSGVIPIGADPDVRAATPTTDTNGMRPWVRAAAPHIGKLLGAAGFLTPRAAADTLAERLGEDEFNDLLDDMYDQENGGFGVRLVQYFPQVKDVDPEWIGAVVQIILTEYVDESEEPETPAPPTNGGTP